MFIFPLYNFFNPNKILHTLLVLIIEPHYWASSSNHSCSSPCNSWPSNSSLAQSSGVCPWWLTGCLSSTCATMRRHISAWPPRAAEWRGVFPSEFGGFLSCTSSKMRRKMSIHPHSAARWSGVVLSSFAGFFSSTLSTMSLLTSKFPQAAARCNGVVPLHLGLKLALPISRRQRFK